jgi:hypothetical protein
MSFRTCSRNVGIGFSSVDALDDLRGDGLSYVIAAVSDPQREADKLECETEDALGLRVEARAVEILSDGHLSAPVMIGGSSTPGNEKTGTLELLNPTLTTVLATISFYNLGIFRLEDAPAAASTTAVPRVVADLYCERMEIS